MVHNPCFRFQPLYYFDNPHLSIKMHHTLEVDSLILDFGSRRLLSDVYIKCETSKITTLLGRNGSGKSCLLNIIFGTLNPLSKSVRIDQHTLHSVYPAINYLPQFHFVPGHLKVRTIFLDYQIDAGRFLSYFPEFSNRMHHRFRQLSGGERRLIEVYMLIRNAAKFTLLDEPFTQIMPVHMEKIKSLIQNETAKGFLITDHLYKHVMDISDNGYLLQNGKTWPVQTLEDLRRYAYIHAVE